jgi:uncharacterized repeat protein (TIGR01451 family)
VFTAFILIETIGIAVAANGNFYLSFPLQNRDSYNAVITSVFDHSMDTSYTPNNTVIAYTGEKGESIYGSDCPIPNPNGGANLCGFKNSLGTNFIVNGHYSGGGAPNYLYYDGHPAYDYSTIDQSPNGIIPVLAAADGVAHNGSNTWNVVYIDHGNGYATYYLHLYNRTVPDNTAVSRGQIIGYSGSTGANAPHLHFEVRKNGVPVDPYGWQGDSVDPYTKAENINLWLHPEIITQSIYCKNMDCSTTPVKPGDNLTFVYNISNPYSYNIDNVRLGAQIRMNNTAGNWTDDPSNDKVVNLLPGAQDYSRNFTVPQSASSGFYDARWVILNDTTGNWIDSKEMNSIFSIQTSVVGGRSGGPDNFGYTFKDSNTQNGPAYNWIDITSTGTMILNNSDDIYLDNLPVGFFFNFYGTDYSQVSITNNGIVLASGGTSQYINQPIGSSTPHNFIAPFWDDLVTWNGSTGGPVGSIYYETMGNAPNREFVVEWKDNQHYSSSSSGVTFEAILYEGSNNIKFQYKNVDFGIVSGSTGSDLPPYDKGGSATAGIEGPDGRGLQYSYNEQVLLPNLAILFKFPQYAGTNLYLSKQAPSSKDRGSTMTYTLFYHNFGDVAAPNVVLKDTLPAEVEFVSASDSGSYDSVTRNVTWNIGDVLPSGHGYENITVRIPDTVAIGTTIQNNARINTSNLEVRYDDNVASAQTVVTGLNLPANVSVEPNFGGIGTPSVYWQTPITFSYQSGPTATGVNITIHIDDGGSDITGSMTGGPPSWLFLLNAPKR